MKAIADSVFVVPSPPNPSHCLDFTRPFPHNTFLDMPSEDNYLDHTLETLRLLNARDIAALYYGTWRLLIDAQENQALPPSQRLDSPSGRIELANGYVQLLSEALLELVVEDRHKAEVVCNYLRESQDSAMQHMGDRLKGELEA